MAHQLDPFLRFSRRDPIVAGVAAATERMRNGPGRPLAEPAGNVKGRA